MMMKQYFKKIFSLSESGACDMVKATIWVVFCNIVLIFFSSILYLFLKDSVENVLENKTPILTVGIYVGLATVLFFILFICYYFQYNATFLASYKESSAKRINLAETIRKLPLSFFGKKDLTDFTTTIMSDVAMMETAFSHFIPQLYGAAISTIIISVGMFCLNVKMALSILWVVPISFFLCYATKKLQDYFGRKTKFIQLSYIQKVQECIENIKDIKANNRKASHINVIESHLNRYEKSSIKSELIVGICVNLAQMILKVGIATSMLMGIYLLASGEIDILLFLVFLMIATRIFDPLSVALINLAAIFISLLSVERMEELENTKIQQGKEIFNNSGFDIVFDEVKFAYNQDEPVLNGISFTAKQGEITALVGPSGGGKSTTIKIAARFWDIASGKITIGDEDISKIDPETLLKNISIVFQDVTLFDNTVLENIRIGKKGATYDEIILAAKAANCHEFIMALPDGYETLIGENGSFLSGGERQRISIARALLKDAPVVFLDEATSSLDIWNEAKVQQAISKLTKNKTVIVVAHRMRTIAGADKIVLIKDGKVNQIGTHAELMVQEGEYSQMIDLQVKSAQWKLI